MGELNKKSTWRGGCSWYGTAHERARCTVKFRSDLTLTHIGEAHPLPERLEQLKRLKFAVE